jgi:hypothetical protein
MDALERYWSGIGQWLSVQAESFNSLIGHMGEKGRANELTVVDFLANLLPSDLRLGGGVLIDPSGQQSRQCDVIVHQVAEHPQLFAQTAQFIFPIDTVVMTMEVKTTLDAAEVAKIGLNTASVRSMTRAVDPHMKPVVSVFAFSTSAGSATTLKWFESLPQDQQPDLVCIVNPGVIIQRDSKSLSAHAILLHQRDDDGQRIAGSWVGSEATESILVDGTRYPSAKVRTATSNLWFAHEPGRALLLFSVGLLTRLGTRGLTTSTWWESYLNKTTFDTVPIDSPS